MHRTRPSGAILLGALVLTACGSTVQHRASIADGGLGQPAEQSSPGASGELSLDQRGSSQLANTNTQATPTSLPTAGTGPLSVGGGAPTTIAAGRLGPGVDATTIRVGFTVQDNNATVNSLASTYNVQLADNRSAYAALVSYINSHGGVAGRKLRPVYYTYDPSSGNADQIGQAACADFTEDNQVFAALDAFEPNSTFNSCMQNRGRLMLEYGLWFGSSSSWTKYSSEVAADGLPFDSAGQILAKSLARTGFLSTSTRLGVIVRSSADLTEAYQHGFVPALAKLGLKVAQTQYIRDAQSESDISGYTTDISSAVLKFKANRVDRVVFFDSGSYSALVFSRTADQQHYNPRYGLMSINGIVSLVGSGSAEPQSQMVGAQGVSWETNADGLTKTPTRSAQLCLAILKAAGIDTSNATTDASYLETCQTFFLFKAAGDAAGTTVNRDTFIRAVEDLRSSFESTNTWGGATRFGAGDHSGVTLIRPFVYDQSCKCFAVSGPSQPVGSS
jgi:ABC-type branched-subunit amino acid transport system substrate-binding protein